MRPHLFQQQYLSYKPSDAPEAIRRPLREPKIKNVLGEHTPDPQEQHASNH